MNNQSLNSAIDKNTAKIGVIGLGYVGMPLIIRFSEVGFNAIGFDIDKKKVDMLNSGKSYIDHIEDELINNLSLNGFKATADFEHISEIDVIIICVPTPLGVHREPDLSYIKNTLDSISPYLKENQLLVLESTTYPGTTEDVVVPIISDKNFEIGENFYLGYSPEREDPGNKDFSTKTIPKIISGFTKNCLEVVSNLYSKVVDQVVPVSSTRVAEMTKILENIHRAVNIGLVNELKMVAHKMDIDIYEVIEAASTKPFGFTPYYPGPGLGGHCIPIDPFYLTWKAKEIGMNTRFIELAGEINTLMPKYVVSVISDALNTYGKAIMKSKILILGLAYKKNIDDSRESPSLEVIDMLIGLGAEVDYSDPYLPNFPKSRKHDFNLKSIDINNEKIQTYDLVLVATDHDKFDFDLIKKSAKIIVDSRGRYNKEENIFPA